MKDNKKNRNRERTEQEIRPGGKPRAFCSAPASRDGDLIGDLEDEDIAFFFDDEDLLGFIKDGSDPGDEDMPPH